MLSEHVPPATRLRSENRLSSTNLKLDSSCLRTRILWFTWAKNALFHEDLDERLKIVPFISSGFLQSLSYWYTRSPIPLRKSSKKEFFSRSKEGKLILLKAINIKTTYWFVWLDVVFVYGETITILCCHIIMGKNCNTTRAEAWEVATFLLKEVLVLVFKYCINNVLNLSKYIYKTVVTFSNYC